MAKLNVADLNPVSRSTILFSGSPSYLRCLGR